MTRWLIVLLIALSAGVTGPWLWRQSALREAPPQVPELAYAPVVLTVDVERLEDALAQAPWVSRGAALSRVVSSDGAPNEAPGEVSGEATGLDQPILWMIGHRACRGCDGFRRAEFPALRDAGVDARVIYFAPDETSGPAERAVLAEIGMRRSWRVFESWLASPAGVYASRNPAPPAVDPIRSAVIIAGRRVRDDVREVMAANGYDVVYPLVLWKTSDGVWHAMTGDSVRARNAVHDAFALGAAAAG